MVVAAAEIWLATKVSDAVATLSAAAAIATTATVVSFAVGFSYPHQCRVANAVAVAISVAFFN